MVANAVNMAMRIVWSWAFVKGFFAEKGLELGMGEMAPGLLSSGLSLAAATYLHSLKETFDGNLMDLVKTLVAGGIYGVVL